MSWLGIILGLGMAFRCFRLSAARRVPMPMSDERMSGQRPRARIVDNAEQSGSNRHVAAAGDYFPVPPNAVNFRKRSNYFQFGRFRFQKVPFIATIRPKIALFGTFDFSV